MCVCVKPGYKLYKNGGIHLFGQQILLIYYTMADFIVLITLHSMVNSVIIYCISISYNYSQTYKYCNEISHFSLPQDDDDDDGDDDGDVDDGGGGSLLLYNYIK